jgi:hypothetical protein
MKYWSLVLLPLPSYHARGSRYLLVCYRNSIFPVLNTIHHHILVQYMFLLYCTTIPAQIYVVTDQDGTWPQEEKRDRFKKMKYIYRCPSMRYSAPVFLCNPRRYGYWVGVPRMLCFLLCSYKTGQPRITAC